MGRDGFRVIGRRHIASAAFLDVERLYLAGPNGEGLERVVVRHPGAVALVPVRGDEVLLIRQYRAAVDRWLLEVPAGKLDVPGEAPEITAQRELREEMGYKADHLELLTSFFSTPGFSDERMYVYVATGLVEVPAAPHGVEEESAEQVSVPVAELLTLLTSGAVEDAKTLVALSLFDATRTLSPG